MSQQYFDTSFVLSATPVRTYEEAWQEQLKGNHATWDCWEVVTVATEPETCLTPSSYDIYRIDRRWVRRMDAVFNIRVQCPAATAVNMVFYNGLMEEPPDGYPSEPFVRSGNEWVLRCFTKEHPLFVNILYNSLFEHVQVVCPIGSDITMKWDNYIFNVDTFRHLAHVSQNGQLITKSPDGIIFSYNIEDDTEIGLSIASS